LSALGTLLPKNSGQAKAFGNLTIAGNLDHSRLLAGYDLTGAAKNADVTIGTVTITGLFEASSIIAGARSDDGNFGIGDLLIGGGNEIIARIAAVTLKGGVAGTPGDGTDSFGIVAEQIGRLKIGTTPVVLSKGAGNDPSISIGGTDDVNLHEIAPPI
jgi:hypothetical protein